MTREHLIEDIENVLEMCRDIPDAEHAQRLSRAFRGLYDHVRAEPDTPERVCSCLEESIRVLRPESGEIDADSWDYARTCLEAALDFAREPSPPAAIPPAPGAAG